jgi:hypothetical protein
MRPSESICGRKIVWNLNVFFYFLLRLEFSAALTLILQFPRVQLLLNKTKETGLIPSANSIRCSLKGTVSNVCTIFSEFSYVASKYTYSSFRLYHTRISKFFTKSLAHIGVSYTISLSTSLTTECG